MTDRAALLEGHGSGSKKRRRKENRAMSKKQVLLISLTTMTVLAAVAVAVVITLFCFNHKRHFHGFKKSSASAEVYRHGAVAADAVTCSEIGRDMLEKNGSAVDAAVAASFCLGLFSMHSTGIGGGGLMVVYKRATKTVETFDYRECAPGKAREEMFLDDATKSKTGGLAIAVPGEVKGLHEAWKKYGQLPWKDLLEPTINMTEQGFFVGLRMHEAAESYRYMIEKDPGLQNLLFDNGKLVEAGTKIKNLPLANTLRKIAENPEDFYTGGLAAEIVQDVRSIGGIITLDDLAKYKVVRRKPFSIALGDLTLYTMTAPTAGPILAHILNILKGYGFSREDFKEDTREIIAYHRIIEALKFGYAQKTRNGDPDFLDQEKIAKWLEDMESPEFANQIRLKISENETHNASYYGAETSPPIDAGTTHLSIYAPNGDAVSLTSTINDWYGASYRSLATGILYNNEMDDFSTPGVYSRFGFPPTVANYIKPGKRPVSSMVPCILVDKSGDVRLVTGGSGGTKIISAVAQQIMYKLWFGDDLGSSVVRPRIHHQLLPDVVGGESNRALDEEVLEGLKKLGHKLNLVVKPEYSAIQAIYVEGPENVQAKSDPRKYGHSAGF